MHPVSATARVVHTLPLLEAVQARQPATRTVVQRACGKDLEAWATLPVPPEVSYLDIRAATALQALDPVAMVIAMRNLVVP